MEEGNCKPFPKKRIIQAFPAFTGRSCWIVKNITICWPTYRKITPYFIQVHRRKYLKVSTHSRCYNLWPSNLSRNHNVIPISQWSSKQYSQFYLREGSCSAWSITTKWFHFLCVGIQCYLDITEEAASFQLPSQKGFELL